MSTRERVIETVITLFTAEGTGPVSTNHIAAAAGLSPGNLYYHFRNKEEIVRAIYAHLRPAWETAHAIPAGRAPAVGDLARILAENARIVWAYRFYYRELPALLRRDPELFRAYSEVRRSGPAIAEALVGQFVASGVMEGPGDPRARAELARICWFLSDFWLPFEELGGEPVDADIVARGVAPILQVLDPYSTPAARTELDSSRPSG